MSYKNPDKRKEYLKAYMKEYMQTHKDSRKEYMKNYFVNNRERMEEKISCEICGGKFKRMSLSHHRKTKKHQVGLELQQLKLNNEEMKTHIQDFSKKFANI